MLALPYPMCCENGTPQGMCAHCKKHSYLGYWCGILIDSDFDEEGNLILSDEEFENRYKRSEK